MVRALLLVEFSSLDGLVQLVLLVWFGLAVFICLLGSVGLVLDEFEWFDRFHSFDWLDWFDWLVGWISDGLV